MFPLLKVEPSFGLVLINTLFWPIVQISVSWIAFKRPASSFREETWLYRTRSFEKAGHFYRKYCGICFLKKNIPDGASLFKGAFQKRGILSRDLDYLHQFKIETFRGEWAHLVMLGLGALTGLWNPPWAMGVMFGCGLVLNLPPILVQRHNRVILQRILTAQIRKQS